MQHIYIQLAVDNDIFIPDASLIRKWAKTVLKTHYNTSTELTIRIVNHDEMSELNKTYRHKQGPTNVLSFPFSVPEEIDLENDILGDIVICAEVVNQEAQEQHKTPTAHWAHMIVHGVYHLLGYDHETDQEAEEMESLEIKTMQALGFANPYAIGEQS